MEGAVDLREFREFTFFDESDAVLFIRNDAESAGWQVDEMNLNCLFPYDENKVIIRGMRIGFVDDDGALQAFEIRKVRDYEPDHYQEVTAEHIVISELTDVHMDESELTDINPASALYLILSKQASAGIPDAKQWALGNVTATNISSGDIGTGSAFQNIRTIETNWNCYITPRLTFDSTGITGRYLDIVPAEGVWHGLRLSVDKNADEIGVTVDDTEVKTALYGYGGTAYTISSNNLDKTGRKITLEGYNWTNKPSGASKATADGFIVDTNANALYGRNGIPRFGFYQNADITDQATLAQKTWEALQTVNKPVVTVDCNVKDLYRLGYHDEKIRLHDTALIEILPIHDLLTLEIVKLYVDLLDPTATRPTIGEYTPNIIFIQRETADKARGGSGGSISGRVGGETEKEAEWSEFQAEFVVNNTILSYHAVQVDHDNKVLKAAGLDIDAVTGAIIYAEDNVNQIGSKFHVQADQISLVVTSSGSTYGVNTASITAAINGDGSSSVYISADKTYISNRAYFLGSALSNLIYAKNVSATSVYATTVGLSMIDINDTVHSVSWKSQTVVTGGTKTGNQWFALSSDGVGITGTMYTSLYSGLNTTTIHYIGY